MIAAQHLKELRLKKNYTQEHLAFELDISQKSYSNLENSNSKITLQLLQKLSKVYDIDVVSLVTKLFESSPETVEIINKSKDENPEIQISHDVNHNFLMELLAIYKERIEDLKKIIQMKDERIEELRRKSF